MSKYELMDTDELGNYLSDYHKDTHGFRPRIEGLYQNRELMIKMLKDLDAYFVRMKETFSGREQLRSEGWSIPETDPDLIQQAKWLQEERDRQEVEYAY